MSAGFRVVLWSHILRKYVSTFGHGCAVYGGDPVYPTVNYEQDPNAVADYRGANFHEPTPSIVEMIRRVSLLSLILGHSAMQQFG